MRVKWGPKLYLVLCKQKLDKIYTLKNVKSKKINKLKILTAVRKTNPFTTNSNIQTY